MARPFRLIDPINFVGVPRAALLRPPMLVVNATAYRRAFHVAGTLRKRWRKMRTAGGGESLKARPGWTKRGYGSGAPRNNRAAGRRRHAGAC